MNLPWASFEKEYQQELLSASGRARVLPSGFWQKVVSPTGQTLMRWGAGLQCLAERRSQLSTSCQQP